ncbi:MAG TPA: hypothetical protein VFQ92_08850 [Blastocatellia bacterium]|nr:hypothetical protein [Blastocatellia bacterium]
MINREAREKSYSEELRQEYGAYLETCKREGLTPGYRDIVEWCENE